MPPFNQGTLSLELPEVWKLNERPFKSGFWSLGFLGAPLVVQTVKNLPAMREIWLLSLSWEDPLEEGMATHSSILAWRIP